MQKTIREIFLEHNGKMSDKWNLYLTEWDRLFAPYQDLQIQLLEIGIQNGGSLEIWSKYFSNAKKFVGCDIDPKCATLRYEDNRIAVIVGDANSTSSEIEILRKASEFDIVIDDGSHKSSDIVRSFARYFPHVRDGGIYVVEDLHASYWNDYEGGIHTPLSAMAFFKRLADIVNYEHWRNNKPRLSLLNAFAENLGIEFEELELTRIHLIEFINSLCIIKKLPPDKNVLGNRMIVGTDEYVSTGWKNLNGTVIQDYSADINDDGDLDVFELIARTRSLTTTLMEKDRTVQALKSQVTEIEKVRVQQVKEKERALQSLSARINEKEQAIQFLQTLQAQKDAQIQQIFHSRAWKVVLLLRSMRQLINKILFPVTKIRRNLKRREDVALIRASGLFDQDWYLANNPDVAQSNENPLFHYLVFGGFEGRDPGPDFSSAWYAESYPDVKSTGMNPLVHYLRYGKQEGRVIQNEEMALVRSSGLFDQGWYLANNPDVRQAKLNPLYHYVFYGGFERRSPGPNFSSDWYYEMYSDVKDAGMNPLVHYLRYGKQEGRESQTALTNEDLVLIQTSGLFDQDWYLVHNPDVAEARVNPLLHYLYIGGFEGRDPGPDFSSKWYLTTYRDVQAAGINPLLHFVKYGIADKRVGHGYVWKRKWGDKIDAAAQTALQAFLDRLNIPLQSKDVLSALKTELAENKFAQMLEDLFTLDQFLSTPHTDSTTYPLIQTSTLPEITEKSHRRRILFITSQFPNPYHGGGNRVLNFIKILSQNNDVYLSTCFVPEEDASELKEIERYCRSIQTIDHTQYGGNQVEIRAWLDDIQIDIVHYEWPRSLENYDPSFGRIQIFTYMEAVSLRLQMDLEKVQSLSRPWLEIIPELSYALCLEIVVAAQLAARIAVTTKDADYFRGFYPYQGYSILNHGVNFDEFSLPDKEPEPHTLIFVGNYTHYPNADAMEFFFSEIWPSVRQAIPDVRIYVVGPNPPERITRFADDQHVIITGGVPDIRSYIQKASIGIAPLISGAGLRGKVIDYAALHRTFVATSIAVTDMAFKDGADFYCADTANDFTQKIIELLQSEQLRNQMSESAFNTAGQNYDSRQLTNFLVRLYEYLEKKGIQIEAESPLVSAPDSTSVQAWLAFYEKRSEIPVRSEKNVDGSMWPKVSILILTYNNFLINQLCLKSLYCNTTYPNFEVIVVDNASSDETPSRLNAFAESHPNLKIVLNTENRGFAAGNNQAASLATGEYLIFLNNDTVVTNGWVERLLVHMRRDPKIGLLGPVTNSTGNEACISVNYHSPVEMEALSDWRARYLAGQAFDIRMLAFYCVMARKDQYNALGGLDERFLVGMFEDDDLAVRYHLQGQRVVCAQDVFIHHFQGASFGKLASSRYAQLFEENKQKYEEKWGRKWEPYKFRKES